MGWWWCCCGSECGYCSGEGIIRVGSLGVEIGKIIIIVVIIIIIIVINIWVEI